jgi:hypothetical protein
MIAMVMMFFLLRIGLGAPASLSGRGWIGQASVADAKLAVEILVIPKHGMTFATTF